MRQIRAGIIGGAGYTGGEMIRILIRHPAVDIRYVYSTSNAGKPVYAVHEDLIGDTTLEFAAAWHSDIDVVFLCVGHGEAKKFLAENSASFDGVIIIDLSQDYRLHGAGGRPEVNGHPFVYGLPELNREEIRSAHAIANPGCFATAIQLGLLPLAQAGLLGDVYTTGITGSTGAGQGLSPTGHFSWRANNIQAYKTLTHQHLSEIGESLQQLEVGHAEAGQAEAGHAPKSEGRDRPGGEGRDRSDGGPSVHFTPWRGDFTRGIFISSQLRCEKSPEEVMALYEDFYRGHPFTIVSRTPISLKQVVNTNKCLIQLEQVGKQLVIHSAIDNLTKGASGQAVQNMNLLFGLEETSGLQLKANAF